MGFFEEFREIIARLTKKDPWAGWVWPVPIHIDGRLSSISSKFGPRKGGAYSIHYGVDIMYRRPEKGTAKYPEFTQWYEMPSGVIPILSPGPGVVWSTTESSSGNRVIKIDHGKVPGFGPLLSVMMHCDRFLVEPKTKVVAGQPIAIIGKTGSDINHVHYEFQRTDLGKTWKEWAVDPAPFMKNWKHVEKPFNPLID